MNANQPSSASFTDILFSEIQQLLPTRFLSWLMFKLTRIEHPGFKNAFIRVFMQLFNISLAEAEHERPEDYRSFNHFFTRALKPDARPLSSAPFVCPVDGTISQLGAIESGRIFQAKGHDYTATELLSGDGQLAQEFANGQFCTIYLAPYNYHRIHMPTGATLRGWRYVPGRLFSVNAATARAMPNLFARNERVVAVFDSPKGAFVMVLVGALFVGSMETVWAGQISPPHQRGAVSAMQTSPSPVQLERGAEMGRFNMGSTVILLAAPGVVTWDASAQPSAVVRMGQNLGQ